MHRTKIMVVNELSWPEGGGAEYATYLILKLLRKLGYKITVITGTKKPKIISGITYYSTFYLTNSNRLSRWSYLEILERQNWFNKLLNQHEILYIPLAAYPLIPLAKQKGLKVIVHFHNYLPIRYYGVKYFFENDNINRYEELKYSLLHEKYFRGSIKRVLGMPSSYSLYMFSKKWIEEADTHICVSKRQAEIIYKNLRIQKSPFIIYNPLPDFAYVNKKIVNYKEKIRNSILYTGGTDLLKGFNIVVDFALRFGINSDFKILMSKISENLKIRRLLEEKYRKHFIFFGRVDYSKLITLYKKSAILLHPSIWEEPLPYSIIESILLGTPVVATKIGGIPEILGKKCDLLCIELSKLYSKDELLREIKNRIEIIFGMNSDEYIDVVLSLKEKLVVKMNNRLIAERLSKIFN